MGLFDGIGSFISNIGSDVGSLFDSTPDTSSTYDPGFDPGAAPSSSSSSSGLGSLLSAGSKALGGYPASQAAGVQSGLSTDLSVTRRLDLGISNPLNSFKNSEAIHTRDQFTAPDSVDAYTLEQQWNQRLKQYADIQRSTGVSETGR